MLVVITDKINNKMRFIENVDEVNDQCEYFTLIKEGKEIFPLQYIDESDAEIRVYSNNILIKTMTY